MSMEYVIELFKRLGLSSSDAKIYILLLSRGPLSSSKIAEMLTMHRPQVHDSIKRLSAKGLVEVLGGRPSTYRAVDPEILFKVFEKEMKDLRAKAREVLSSLEISAKEVDYGVWMLRSYEGITLKAEGLIEKAQIDLAVCGSEEFILRMIEKLRRARERGVLVYTIVYSKECPKRIIPVIKKYFDKVKWAISGDIMVIADSKEAVLVQRRIKDYGLYIREPVLIDYLLHDFFNRWVRGRTIRDSIVKLPRRFTIHRLALLEAKRMVESGKKLSVRVEGRSTKNDTYITIEGLVHDVVLDFSTGLMHFSVETKDGILRVGGPDAIVEECAAHVIELEEVTD
ncbi:MAG: hypothetical protein DRN91_08135 [Candidatus Alkanophagales archaeon]|nr:MAG: hypothetical protein DRN91_08135 [Candidatus Alkanophagales archaeon]